MGKPHISHHVQSNSQKSPNSSVGYVVDPDVSPFILFIQCEAPKIAKLVNITPITMVYGTQITIVTGAYKPTNITGGGHIVSQL